MHIAGSANGRPTDSGSVNLGSNPSPAATKKNRREAIFFRLHELDFFKFLFFDLCMRFDKMI